MKKTLFRTIVGAGVLSMLAACGGGGSEGIGSSIVQISFDQPKGLLEAGQLITVKGRAVSKNAKLKSMTWSVTGAGSGNSAPTLINNDCKDVDKSDSSFGAGSSTWSCTVTLQAPTTLAAPTAYDLSLSASSESYSGQGSTRVTVKPATSEPNPIQVQFSSIPENARAGQAINVSGVITSNASPLTDARWSVVNTGASQASTFPVPTIENADCTVRTESTNPAVLAGSMWNCSARMIVSPRLTSATDYQLTLVGTNAAGFALSNSVSVPVAVAQAVSNKVAVTLSPAPTSVQAGEKVTIAGTIKSTGSFLDKAKSGFSVVNVSPANASTSATDYNIVSKCVEVANPTGAPSTDLACTGTFTVPTTVSQAIVITYALSGVDDEGFSNYATQDMSVAASLDSFGLRAAVSYSPDPVVRGAPVNLTCAAAGGSGTNYTYAWRVVDSGGTSINLSAASNSTGNATFTAPSPVAATSIELECGVSVGNQPPLYTPLTVLIPA